MRVVRNRVRIATAYVQSYHSAAWQARGPRGMCSKERALEYIGFYYSHAFLKHALHIENIGAHAVSL